MVWNYHDDDRAGDAHAGPSGAGRIAARGRASLVEHYRIDDDHSNAYTAWQQMGSPQKPTDAQYARLEAAGQLQLLRSPEWLPAKDGKLEVAFPLPRQSVSLVRVSW